MEFTILGPLEARAEGRVIPLGGPKQRAVLAQLLLNAGEVVSRDRLVEGTWSEPPASADKAVQVHVSQLRKALGPRAPIQTRAHGYVAEVAPEQLDLSRFERLRAEARAALDLGDGAGAARGLREALDLWRGQPLAEFAQEPFAAADAARLAEVRLATLEDRIDADLALGRHGDLVAELEALVAAEPRRERLVGQLMLALYRSGRQAEALEAYRDAHRLLGDELGLDPGPALQRLERAILLQDPKLELEAAPPPPKPPANPAPRPTGELPLEVRKTITAVFCDVTGSTGIGESRDPELMRRVMSRYFEEMRIALEGHGGTVEKFIGDAVMAVFGTPVMHEDDALRALRAAAGMREGLAVLNEELDRSYGVRLEIRIGVSSGEVVAGDPTRAETFVTGDAVVVAQRLQVEAEPGEILLGERTYRLARGAIDAEALEPLKLKGKAEHVVAYRLLAVRDTAQPRLGSPMVGRGRERLLLQDAFGRAVQQRGCHLFTVLGPAGVGKSRLVAEALEAIGDRARVLTGTCLPYGEGITFRPVAEIVAQAVADDDLRAGVERLVGGSDGGVVAEQVASLAAREGPSGSAEESFWAVRRLLEALARDRPTVVVFDDVNWAEPTLLDLIEHVAEWTRDAPLLLVCMARPELHEVRPTWGGGKHNATSIFLEPLTDVETDRLVRNLLGAGELDEEIVQRIRRAAGGNPLFVEELVALLLEEGLLHVDHGRWRSADDLQELPVPASIQVLLASRLDLLEREERQVLERAAIEGQRFHRSAVVRLSDQEPATVGASLQALVRKELVRQAGDDEFRFRHLLIRDAAYEAMPKQVRSVLHERFAEWAESRSGDEVELDEILGHHLEQAYAYRVALGPAGPAEDALAARAADRLAVAGRRALARHDSHVAARLLGRAALLRTRDPELLVDLGEALFGTGDFTEADRVYEEARTTAAVAGDARSEVAARLASTMIGLLVRAEGGVDEIAADVNRALPTFEQAGDDVTVARLLTRLAAAFWWRCQVGSMEETLERALEHARRADDDRQREEIAVALGIAAVIGPLPVEQARPRLDELLAETATGSTAHGLLLVSSGLLAAMAGEFDDARRLCREGREVLDSLDRPVGAAAITTWSSAIELLAGDAAAAERELRPALARLEDLGELANLASLAAQLAETLEVLGRHEEALVAARTSEEAASPDDVHAQIAWRAARAKVLASLGRPDEAERAAREAVELAGTTDSPLLAADALLSLAEAHAARGAVAESRAAAESAVRLYEAKGNIVAAQRARALIGDEAAARTPSTAG